MKIIYNKLIPIKKFTCTNIFGILFARDEEKPLSDTIINHESIHTAQMKELLYIGFYMAYGVEYLIKLIKYGDSMKAYANISFEKEAYLHQNDMNYLNNRKHYAQWRKH